MTKNDLINAVCETNGHLPKTLVSGAVNVFFAALRSAIIRHQRVELRSLGSFSLRKRRAYMARNPQTGEHVEITEKWAPFFKPSSILKKRLQGEELPYDLSF